MLPESTSVLIIDDDCTLLTILKTYLEGENFKIYTAESGELALSLCKNITPDIILLDLVMPNMDGIETCSRLKLLPSLINTPIIIITSNTDSKSIISSFDTGAIDFITKPIDHLLLSKRIHSALRATMIDLRLNSKQKELFEVEKSAKIGTIKISIINQTIELSTSCYKHFGFSSEHTSFTFSDFIDHIHPDDKDHVFYTLANTLKNHEDHILEYRFQATNDEQLIIYQQCEFIDDIDAQELYLFGSFQDVTQLRNLQDNLDHRRDYDPLTNLPNNVSFKKQVNRIVKNPPSDTLFAVIFISLDNLKTLYDEFGTSGVDSVIKEISERLCVFELDGHYVSRFSHDIFTLLIKNLKHIDACNTALDNIQELIKTPIHINNNKIYITASIGVSVYPLESDSVSQLLTSAESAMALSKDSGGNRYTYRTYDMNIETQRRLTLLKELRSALSKKQIQVYFQPQVDTNSLKIVGMEALVRWIHPQHGFIPPDEFIPLAEESGIIIEIGEYVLEKSCSLTKKWIDMGFELNISVNVSGHQFENNRFLEHLKATLSETKLPPQNLEIEITESMAVKNHKNTISILNNLREMNIKTSMDDFGTGYSSLSQLQTLPLDTLKVDQAFVRCIASDGDSNEKQSYKNSAIANAIIVMAHSLGLTVIAEGVETTDQRDFLKSMKSEILQGYLFSRPVPADEFEALLLNNIKK